MRVPLADPDLLQGGSARPGHYSTSYESHYTQPGTKLVVPPGKGGVDMTHSSVPLGRAAGGNLPTGVAHSASMFTGQQVPEHARMRTCSSRGTLGTRRIS